MLTTERQATLVRQPSALSGTAAGTDTWASGAASCPDDCHYCSGPETD
jgi:hypothetical protein